MTDIEIKDDVAEEKTYRPYVSFHNHTSYSFYDALTEPAELFQRAKELGQPAVVVTDHGTLAGLWDCLKASRKTGVKLIAGCEFNFVDDVNDEGARMRHIILAAKNAKGYRNLLLASKTGYDNKTVVFRKVIPRIDWNVLEKYKEGLICTTACGSGIISQLINNKHIDEAREAAQRLKAIFEDDLAIEIQPHALRRNANLYSDYVEQTYTNKKLIEIAKELDIKIIATTDSHYLNKEDWKAHDVMLAMGSGQPINSGARLKYNVNDFYVKSGDEIFDKVARKHGKEFAQEVIDNTLYFANKCEFPDWIDPKFSNPYGKELPEFPVKDQLDYDKFKEWLSTTEEGKDAANIPEDFSYLRYWCYRSLDKFGYGQGEKKEKAVKRIKEELDVLEYHGFSSYMLLTADILQFARDKKIRVGPGRGCLDGNTKVLTTNGYKDLKDISVGDKVFTHKGRIREVLNTFEYDIDEECVNIKSEFSFDPIQMTKDHKVYAVKSEETEQYKRMYKANSKSLSKVRRWKEPGEPSWYSISELKENDLIFTPYIGRDILIPQKIDLANSVGDFDFYNVLDDKITRSIPLDNKYSIRGLANKSGLSRNALKNVKCGGNTYQSTIDTINNNLDGLSVEEWVALDNTEMREIPRFIDIDSDFCYLIGRWVGDGWCAHTAGGSYEVGFAFHSEDLIGINKITSILKRYGISVRVDKASDKKLIQLIIINPLLFNLCMRLVPDYKQSSNTKHLPVGFRGLPDHLLLDMLNGLIDSDGHIERGGRNVVRENIDTTSYRLACEVKEALLYLKIPSSIYTRKEFIHGKYLCKQSYKLRFKGIKTKRSNRQNNCGGYFNKIIEINHTDKLKKVYDITVKDDYSYLTSNYAVHNSVGGSFVGYLLEIHIADPFKHGLIFARFHNKEKTDFPDIDNDFASIRRHEVIEYVKNKYGEDYVAQVGNVSRLTPKPFVKAIARTFLYGGDRKEAVAMGATIAATIPSPTYSGITSIDKALEKCPLFVEYTKKYTELAEYASLSGRSINWSTHAAGFVIGKRPLPGLVPLRRDEAGDIVVEFEKERTEQNGLVKVDFLGLETLDIIDMTRQLIAENGKTLPSEPFDYYQYDKKTYDMISNGDVLGVFQLGKSAGESLCRSIKPKSIEDLALINALIRPSAKDIRDDFIKARNGEKAVKLTHPRLERAFRSTYGFGVFEECLMYLAQDIPKWSQHEADRLRKMTKEKGKYPEKVKKWRKQFIVDCMANGIEKKIATKIWDNDVAKFGGYAFNKSHAVLYSLTGFETAYYKANFPLEFMVANLMFTIHKNGKEDFVLSLKENIRRHNVKILPPDINSSEMVYKIINDNTLMTGINAMKYMGKDAIPEILANRPFNSFEEFLTKCNGSKVKAPAVQALAASGALDLFNMPRRQMFLYASDFKKKLKVHNDRNKKKNEDRKFKYPWPDESEWAIPEIYALEKHYLGEGLSGNKIDVYKGFFTATAANYSKLHKRYPEATREEIRGVRDRYRIFKLEGEIKSIFEFKVKDEKSKIYGQQMARVGLEDPFGNQVVMVCFPEGLDLIKERFKDLSRPGNVYKFDEIGTGIKINGSISWYQGDISIIFEDLVACCHPPALPPDMKDKKKISMRTIRTRKKKDRVDAQLLLEEVEEELAEEGYANLDDDEQD